jgi:hypothetical protein
MTKQTVMDKWLKDDKGKYVFFQAPNWSLIGWAMCKLLGYFHLPARYGAGFTFLSEAFLFTWASLELTSGINYSRRLLGLVVLVFLVGSHF